MHEGRRFLLALALVGGCVAIAGVLVATAPPVTWPAAPGGHVAPLAETRPLPRLPLPQWKEPAVRAQAAPRREGPPGSSDARHAVASIDQPSLGIAVAAIGEPVLAQPSLATPSLPAESHLAAVALPPAPQDAGVPARQPVVAAGHAERDHGPVTGAFVTVGAQVGKGVRSFGRTLKKVF
jgi:hypothetical protein